MPAGLPERPYRYDELAREGEATITLPGEYYADHPRAHRHGYAGRHHREEDRYARHYAPPPPPPPERPYAHGYEERADRYDERSRRYGQDSARGWRGEIQERPLPPPPPPPPRYGRYGSWERYDRYGRSAGFERREYRSYSETTSFSERTDVQGGCCASGQAAGLDSRGYLTWPGKTPAR